MNDWETIEKIVNTLPQWDVIKLIIGIQEELKCAKEDNLYQLRKNKDLQNRIDKAYEQLQLLHYNFPDYDEIHHRIQDIEDFLKESGE